MLDDVLVMVLAGGVGERLYPLTKERAKPAVYFGGPYRIIDFTLSNCINSGLRRIFIATAVQVAVAQPPHPHGLERRRRRARRVHRDPAARRSASASTGISARPTRSIRTSTRSCARTRGTSSCSRAITSTRWTTRSMLRVPPGARRGGDARRRSRSRPRRRSRFGVLQVDERRPADGLPREAEGPAARAARCSRRWASTSSTWTSWCRRSRPTRAARPTHDFGKDIIPALIAQGAGLRLPLLRREQEGVEVLARHRHARRVLRSEHGPVPGEPGVQPVRSRSGRCAPIRSQAPPAKFVFADEGRRCGQALDSIISAGCIISGSRICGQRALPERARAQLLRHRAEHPDAGRPRRPARADPPRDHRPRRVHPARRADRLQRRRRSPAPHGHRKRHRRRHDRRRAVHRRDRAKRRCGTRRSSIDAGRRREQASKARSAAKVTRSKTGHGIRR